MHTFVTLFWFRLVAFFPECLLMPRSAGCTVAMIETTVHCLHLYLAQLVF